MLVSRNPGHSTDTPTADPSAASSWCSDSLEPDDRELARAVDAEPTDTTEPGDRRGVHDVPSSCPSRIGRKVAQPWITPKRFTPSTQLPQLDRRGRRRCRPRRRRCCTRRARRRTRRARARASVCTSLSTDTSVGTPITAGTRRLQLSDRGRQHRLLDVGEHELHALGREPQRQRAADPLAPPVITATRPSKSCTKPPGDPTHYVDASRPAPDNRTTNGQWRSHR